MKPAELLQCSQEPTPGPYPSQFTHYSLNMHFNIIPSDLFSCNYMTKIPYAFFIFTMHAIHTAHHIHIDYTDTHQLKPLLYVQNIIKGSSWYVSV